MKDLKDILKAYEIKTDKRRYISVEWQEYAYRLAIELEDLAHKGIYMRLAKNTDRAILEEARIFVRGSFNAKNKGKLFMWKLKKLKEEAKKVVNEVHDGLK